MRFGSLTDFSKRYLKFKEIREALNLKESTLRMIVKRFRDQGYHMIEQTSKRFSKIPLTVQQYLLQHDTLTEWGHLSLLERCRKLRFEQNVRKSANHLRQFYLTHNIKYTKVQLHKQSKFDKATEIQEKRLTYAMQITQSVLKGKDIVYIDQTTFSSWDNKKYTWQRSDHKIKFHQMDNKKKNFTLYGGIASKLGQFITSIEDSTSISGFKHFLEVFLAKHIQSNAKVMFVLDNHSSHRSKKVIKALEDYSITPVFLPPYSSELNPIEKVWNLVKMQWRKLILENNGDPVLESELQKAKITEVCWRLEHQINFKKIIASVDQQVLEILNTYEGEKEMKM